MNKSGALNDKLPLRNRRVRKSSSSAMRLRPEVKGRDHLIYPRGSHTPRQDSAIIAVRE